MSDRIESTFAKLKETNTPAFIAYVCAGDPTIEKCLDVIKGIADAGADIIELGVPFSDPVADGVVNQLASDRALSAGCTFAKVLQLVRDFRQTHETPIVFYSYLNMVYTYGYERFSQDAHEAGVDGVLLLDLPPDEATRNSELSQPISLKKITLIAPNTPDERVIELAQQSEGFVYALSRTGVTGAQAAPSEGIGNIVANIKQHTDNPVCVGFGINTPEQAAMVASVSDGIIVGSAIVNQVAENADSDDIGAKVAAFVKPLADAAHSAKQ